jgi:hypothetical protein
LLRAGGEPWRPGLRQIGMFRFGTAGLRILILGGLAGLLLGCGSHHTQDVPASGQVSGIQGHTTVGPACPVEQAESPCPDRPQRARLTVTKAGSAMTLATAVSDPTGYFSIPVPPGRYTVQASKLSKGILPAAPPVTVIVVAGRYTSITISFDSGIR